MEGGAPTATGAAINTGAAHLQTLLEAFNCYDSEVNPNNGNEPEPVPPQSHVPAASVTSASADGVCECCGARFKTVGLDSPARSRLRSALQKLAAERWASGAYAPATLGNGDTELEEIFGVQADVVEAGGGRAGEERDGCGANGGLEQFACWLDERREEVRLWCASSWVVYGACCFCLPA